MISLHVFMLGVLAVSIFTGLTTEGIKKLLVERNKKYYANTLAGIVAICLSIGIGVGYVLITGITFSTPVIVCIVGLVFIGWLCAMVGYDKVTQAISQFKMPGTESKE